MTKLADMKTTIFAVEGVQHLDRSAFRLEIAGLVENAHTLTLPELKTKVGAATTINSRLTSVSGWSVRANWDGITWQDFVNYAKPLASARYACLPVPAVIQLPFAPCWYGV